MGRSEVDAALERLVSQFASPYDFLRELVQNSMDAGSDRVEVSLERHLETASDLGGTADGKDAIFELVVMDTGVGMDEAIIDGALTRLFASTKAEDRTMAGGFGVGFVSVFAWEPDAVLLQTGRGGEAWELTFYADRRFEKTRLDTPVEGTTITLLRRADAGAYAAVVDAVRDSLWRWCRYAQVEISFEDFSEGDGPELVQDAPTPEDYAVSRSEKVGDGHVHAAFGIPPSAVMMRRGLILEEGDPGSLIAALGKSGRSAEHLVLWVDSPELETTIARDSIVQSKGRERIEAKVLEQVERLRGDLLDELEALCDRVEPWGESQRLRYANLHAHLELEWEQLGPGAGLRRIFRAVDMGDGRSFGGQLAWTLEELRARCAGGPLIVRGAFASEAGSPCWGSAWPVLEGSTADATWVRAWGSRLGLRVAELPELLGRCEPYPEDRETPESESALLRDVSELLRALTGQPVAVGLAPACDEHAKDPPLCAWQLGDTAMTSRRGLPPAALHALALDRRHLLVQACLRSEARARWTARLTLASALLSSVTNRVAPKDLQELAWEKQGRG